MSTLDLMQNNIITTCITFTRPTHTGLGLKKHHSILALYTKWRMQLLDQNYVSHT